MHSNCRFLPDQIVWKITQRNNIRRENTCAPALKLLNEEITFDIQKHKQSIWKEHLDAHRDHTQNTYTLWNTIHGLSNRAHPTTLNNTITFNNKITTTPKHSFICFTEQFTDTVRHATHKANRSIDSNRYHHGVCHTVQPDIVDNSTRTIIRSITHYHHNEHTTDYNKTDGISPTKRKSNGHISRKTQSPLSLRPTYILTT